MKVPKMVSFEISIGSCIGFRALGLTQAERIDAFRKSGRAIAGALHRTLLENLIVAGI